MEYISEDLEGEAKTMDTPNQDNQPVVHNLKPGRPEQNLEDSHLKRL